MAAGPAKDLTDIVEAAFDGFSYPPIYGIPLLHEHGTDLNWPSGVWDSQGHLFLLLTAKSGPDLQATIMEFDANYTLLSTTPVLPNLERHDDRCDGASLVINNQYLQVILTAHENSHNTANRDHVVSHATVPNAHPPFIVAGGQPGAQGPPGPPGIVDASAVLAALADPQSALYGSVVAIINAHQPAPVPPTSHPPTGQPPHKGQPPGKGK